jgi:HAD superfamily hydrolase (TIGR01509 family)
LDFAVIFDMDGVIVDSNPYHKKAWKAFCCRHNISINDYELETKIYGRTGDDALPVLFDRPLDKELIAEFCSEINKNYRDLFAPFIKPLPGLLQFLDNLMAAGIKTAIATSAPPVNVEFVLQETGIEKYFNVIIDDTMITRGKPDPEIYFKTAEKLKKPASDCVVFEDSLAGITAAKYAGMKVTGVTTTHDADTLSGTDFIINDFFDITVNDLVRISEKREVL